MFKEIRLIENEAREKGGKREGENRSIDQNQNIDAAVKCVLRFENQIERIRDRHEQKIINFKPKVHFRHSKEQSILFPKPGPDSSTVAKIKIDAAVEQSPIGFLPSTSTPTIADHIQSPQITATTLPMQGFKID